MGGIRDNRQIRNILSCVMFLLSGAMFFFDWWAASLLVFTAGVTPLELMDTVRLYGALAGDNSHIWILIALIVVGIVIIHAVICRVMNASYRGIGVPAVVLAAVVCAGIIAAQADLSMTVVPFLALLFAITGVLAAPAHITSAGTPSKDTAGESAGTAGIITGISGAYKGASFAIADGETLTFGRDPAICHVVFDSSNISRAHCSIRYSAAENSYYVKDTSRNGTYYEDGIRMQPQRESAVTAGEKIYLDDPNEMFKLG